MKELILYTRSRSRISVVRPNDGILYHENIATLLAQATGGIFQFFLEHTWPQLRLYSATYTPCYASRQLSAYTVRLAPLWGTSRVYVYNAKQLIFLSDNFPENNFRPCPLVCTPPSLDRNLCVRINDQGQKQPHWFTHESRGSDRSSDYVTRQTKSGHWGNRAKGKSIRMSYSE